MCDNLTIRAIDFYKNKDSVPYYTTEFIKKYQQKGGGYIAFAKTFITDGKSAEELRNKTKDPEIIEQCNNHIDNYIEIKNLIKQGDLDKVDALRDVPLGFVLNVKNDYTVGEPNQQWHFLVSYCAQHELEARRANKDNEAMAKAKAKANILSIQCPELWLWLIEAARDDDIIKKEDVIEAYEQAVRLKEIGNKEWNTFLKIYKEKVKAIIIKWDRERSICI